MPVLVGRSSVRKNPASGIAARVKTWSRTTRTDPLGRLLAFAGRNLDWHPN
jgi:hypothetical protein